VGMCVVSVAQTLHATISGRSERGGRKKGHGDSEQDFVGSVGMLAEPIGLRSKYGM